MWPNWPQIWNNLKKYNEDDSENIQYIHKEINTKINDISINKELKLLNKNMNIINNFDNHLYFIISKLLDNNESKIIHKLLINYLNANIIEDKNNGKRSNSFNKINNNNTKIKKKNIKKLTIKTH